MADIPQPLAPATAALLLRGTAAALAAEARGLPEALLRWHPAAGEWCVKEVLGHLVEAERRGFAGRITIILAGARPVLQRWDPAEVARARKDCEGSAEALVTELLAMRRERSRARGDAPPRGPSADRPSPHGRRADRQGRPPGVGAPRPESPQADPDEHPGLCVAAHGQRPEVLQTVVLYQFLGIVRRLLAARYSRDAQSARVGRR